MGGSASERRKYIDFLPNPFNTMKKIIALFSMFIALSFVVGCGGGNPQTSTPATDHTGSVETHTHETSTPEHTESEIEHEQ